MFIHAVSIDAIDTKYIDIQLLAVECHDYYLA